MTDYGTIKIPKDAYDRHNDRRKDAELTWEQYFERESVTITHDTVDYDDVRAAAKAGAREAIEEV